MVCPECGVRVPEAAAVCPLCRTSLVQLPSRIPGNKGMGGSFQRTEARAAALATEPAVGVGARIAAAAAYLTLAAALILLVVSAFWHRPLVRFHAMQALLFELVWTLISAALAFLVLNYVSGFAFLIFWPLYGMASFLLWAVLVVKAAQAELFQLPLLGPLALRCARV